MSLECTKFLTSFKVKCEYVELTEVFYEDIEIFGAIRTLRKQYRNPRLDNQTRIVIRMLHFLETGHNITSNPEDRFRIADLKQLSPRVEKQCRFILQSYLREI